MMTTALASTSLLQTYPISSLRVWEQSCLLFQVFRYLLAGNHLKLAGLLSEFIAASFCVGQEIHCNFSFQFQNIMSQSNEDAAQTEAALLAQGTNNHRNVVVLLFSWKEDEDGAWGEVEKLEAAFKLFNFTVKTPLIPKRYP
jgi:uncharacterized membrane protein YciS (DUF1049 family)